MAKALGRTGEKLAALRCVLGAATAMMLAFSAGFDARAVAWAGNWSESMWKTRTADFGEVPRGTIARHNFVFTNGLPQTVTISDIRASCGCTTGVADKTVVAPGESAIVQAVMDTRNVTGKKETVLFVTLTAPGGYVAEARLQVAARVQSDLLINPGVVDFGTVNQGQSTERTITVTRLNNPNWRVTRMSSQSRAIDASIVETLRSFDRVTYQLTVVIAPGAAPGLIHDEIRIFSDDPNATGIPVVVHGMVREVMSATPKVLNLARTAATTTPSTTGAAPVVSGKVMIRASAPFTIVSVTGQSEDLVVDLPTPVARTVQMLEVRYLPNANANAKPSATAKPGAGQRTLTVKTSLPGEPQTEVTVLVQPQS